MRDDSSGANTIPAAVHGVIFASFVDFVAARHGSDVAAKILADQETSGDASPAKDAGDGDTIAVTPASKKKAGGRKRKTGEPAHIVHSMGM